ncbi:hypothetical protein [Nocardia sp. NBC_00416]|uniref:hypothetical protein n=1 Tax=Nocardia sp. NBC_00416 TaxID=2975991 RepID=UPI002E222485
MHRIPRTRRLAVRIATAAAIVLAPLAVTAAPALADNGAPAGIEVQDQVQDVSRPGRHGNDHGWNGGGRHDRGWNGGRHDRGWDGGWNGGGHHDRGWNGGGRHDRGWNGGGWNDRGRHDNGWNRGWDRGYGQGYGLGLPLIPRIYLPGSGSAF